MIVAIFFFLFPQLGVLLAEGPELPALLAIVPFFLKKKATSDQDTPPSQQKPTMVSGQYWLGSLTKPETTVRGHLSFVISPMVSQGLC